VLQFPKAFCQHKAWYKHVADVPHIVPGA